MLQRQQAACAGTIPGTLMNQPDRPPRTLRPRVAAVGVLALVLVAVVLLAPALANTGTPAGPTGAAAGSAVILGSGSPGATLLGSPSETSSHSFVPGSSAPAGIPKLLFGLGSEAGTAAASPLVKVAPVRILSSWFNGHGDLSWMTGWSSSLIPAQYAVGRALHLIVYASGNATTTTQTKYGPACGRPYPLTALFQSDMAALAKIWAGTAKGPPLYVTMFTEFQTYACHQGAWLPDQAYWSALKDAYTRAEVTFHRYAPNAKVSLGWGGWQERWDDPSTGGGRSMLQHFADVMGASDFQSFQAMESDTNVADVLAMTRALHAWGPVMLAHYKPDNGSQATFDADTSAMLTDAYLRQATAAGLFAWSFMDQVNMNANPADYTRIRDAVRRYGS